MESVNTEDFINFTRLPKRTNHIPLIVYAPFGFALAIVRCFIFIHALLIFLLFSWLPFFHSFIIRVMFAICGLVIMTDGTMPSERRRLVLVSNHITTLDPFILSMVMQHTLVMQFPYYCSTFVHLCKQLVISGDKSREEVLQYAKRAVDVSKSPLLFFPEGSRTNGIIGLLQFRSLPFELDVPIQPIGITARRGLYNINISYMNSSWWADLLFCFFVPFTVFSIKFLPVTEKRESESCEQFAERTQANLAKHLGIIATSVTLSDLLESMKPKQEGRQKKSISQSVIVHQTDASSRAADSDQSVVSSDEMLNTMLRQVQDVLPHANSLAVLRDLESTRDVDVTITNILEGRVHLGHCSTSASSSSSIESHMVTFKASSFPKSASERQMSLLERKQAMLAAAQEQYKQKHGIH